MRWACPLPARRLDPASGADRGDDRNGGRQGSVLLRAPDGDRLFASVAAARPGLPPDAHATADIYNVGATTHPTGLAVRAAGETAFTWQGEALAVGSGWDRYQARLGPVVAVEGGWVGTYDGSASHEENYEERCGLATSTDLRHWQSLTPDRPWWTGPGASGSIRYVDLQRIDGAWWCWAERPPDGAHELRVVPPATDPAGPEAVGFASVTPSPPSRPSAAAILGCLTLLTIGWTGLLVPSAIRSIEATFGQATTRIGVIYLLYSGAYAAGSFGGGPLTERIGRRRVLVAAAILHGLGIASFGLAPTWGLFVASALLAGLGGGGLDGGSNGLYLDLFRPGRGRAMNLLHLFFSIGALSAPLVVGALIEGGVAWQSVFVGSALAPLAIAAWYAVAAMPSGRAGRRRRVARMAPPNPGPCRLVSGSRSRSSRSRWPPMSPPRSACRAGSSGSSSLRP